MQLLVVRTIRRVEPARWRPVAGGLWGRGGEGLLLWEGRLTGKPDRLGWHWRPTRSLRDEVVGWHIRGCCGLVTDPGATSPDHDQSRGCGHDDERAGYAKDQVHRREAIRRPVSSCADGGLTVADEMTRVRVAWVEILRLLESRQCGLVVLAIEVVNGSVVALAGQTHRRLDVVLVEDALDDACGDEEVLALSLGAAVGVDGGRGHEPDDYAIGAQRRPAGIARGDRSLRLKNGRALVRGRDRSDLPRRGCRLQLRVLRRCREERRRGRVTVDVNGVALVNVGVCANRNCRVIGRVATQFHDRDVPTRVGGALTDHGDRNARGRLVEAGHGHTELSKSGDLLVR